MKTVVKGAAKSSPKFKKGQRAAVSISTLRVGLQEASYSELKQYAKKAGIKSSGVKVEDLREQCLTHLEVNPKQGSKSAYMIELFKSGLGIYKIAKDLGSPYSFVYGVVKRYKAKIGE